MKKVLLFLLVIVVIGIAVMIGLAAWYEKSMDSPEFRAREAQRMAEKKAQETAENQTKQKQETARKNAKLILDETFQDNQLHGLQAFASERWKLQGNKLISNTVVAFPWSELILMKQPVTDFIAEMDLNVWQRYSQVGIVFAHTLLPGEKYANEHRIFVNPLTITQEIDNSARAKNLSDVGLGVINEQKLRVEKQGNHLKISVNGENYFDTELDEDENRSGQIGIYLGCPQKRKEDSGVFNTQVEIKRFKVWAW